MFVYLPSCKFTAANPEESGKLKAYFAEKDGGTDQQGNRAG